MGRTTGCRKAQQSIPVIYHSVTFRSHFECGKVNWICDRRPVNRNGLTVYVLFPGRGLIIMLGAGIVDGLVKTDSSDTGKSNI